jgi:hypothetical protein
MRPSLALAGAVVAISAILKAKWRARLRRAYRVRVNGVGIGASAAAEPDRADLQIEGA